MKTLVSFIFILLMQSAYSQTSLFEGAYYGIGFVAGSTNSKVTTTDTGWYENSGQSMQAGSFEVGYGFLYKDEFIINLKATYDLTNPEVNSGLDYANRTDTQKTHFSFAVEPGYLIGSKTLAFGKLSIHSNKVHYFRDFISGTYVGQTSNATTTYLGYGVGAGIKTELANHVVIGIDTEIVNYGSKNPYFVRSGGENTDKYSYKLTSNITTISISKKF